MRSVFLLPFLIVIFNWLWMMPLPLWVKGAGALLVLLASQFHALSRLSSGSVFAPEMPRPVVVLFNWAVGAVVLLAVFQLVLDLGWVLVSLVRWQGATIPVMARAGAGVLAGGLAAIGVANALRVPPVRDEVIEIEGLDPAFDGYRLLQLSDLHLSRLYPARWCRAVVARANAAGADLITVTGDFIDGSVAMRRDDIAPLAGLRARDGVIGVPGNHEYFFNYADWMAYLAGLNMRILENAHVVIRRDDGALVVAGVTDLSAGHHGEAAPDLAAALAGAPVGAPVNVPVILLDHQPRRAREAAAQGVALQLSGHTHGGMMPGLDRLVARGNAGFVTRRYTVGAMTLYVSNGTGIWPGFAMRLGRASEMTRFTLRARAWCGN